VKIFLSHSSREAWIAGQIRKEIEEIGGEVWLDDVDIETGDEAEAEMREGLDNCSELLVLLSPFSVDRPYVWMEIGVAWSQRKRVVGVLNNLTRTELLARDGMPAFLKGIRLRELNDLDGYLEELKRRIERG